MVILTLSKSLLVIQPDACLRRPVLYSNNADLVPATGEIRDVNHDKKWIYRSYSKSANYLSNDGSTFKDTHISAY